MEIKDQNDLNETMAKMNANLDKIDAEYDAFCRWLYDFLKLGACPVKTTVERYMVDAVKIQFGNPYAVMKERHIGISIMKVEDEYRAYFSLSGIEFDTNGLHLEDDAALEVMRRVYLFKDAILVKGTELYKNTNHLFWENTGLRGKVHAFAEKLLEEM